MPAILVAQLGARRHYAVPLILHQAGLLAHLFTDICATKGWPRLLRLTPPAIRPKPLRRLLGRVPNGIPGEKITAFTDLGFKYVRQLGACRDAASSTRVCLRIGQEFCERILAAGFGGATAVYAFNSAGLELLQSAKQVGLQTFMEQTIAPAAIQQRLLKIEADKHPAWVRGNQLDAFPEAIARETAEWATADMIICGSQFVADAVHEVGGQNAACTVVSTGVDLRRYPCPPHQVHSGPLRVLTIGSLGLRKGTPYVLAAAAELGNLAEFRLVGPGQPPPEAAAALPKNVKIMGQIPRNEIQTQLAWADVFLLPSICEGSSVAVHEALASGVPVICTPNTGSLVRDGIDGFLVPAGDTAPIVERLHALGNDRCVLVGLRDGARSSGQHCGLTAYAQRLEAAVASRGVQAERPLTVV
jgi:glycosyltransferase involved in cell wall biosynthesis